MTSENVLEHVIGNYVIPAICVFGIICNILNIVILTRRTMTESPYTYLMGIGVADIALLILAFIEVVFSQRSTQGLYFWKFYDCYIFFPFANVFANSTVWVTVLMTIERFVSVQYPLRAKELCTKTLARRCIIGVFAFSIFINIPRFFCMKIVKASEGKYVTRSSDFEMSTFYKAVTWFYIISIHAIPLTVIGTLNSCLVWALYRAQRHRTELQEPQINSRSKLPLQTSREQRRLTITCIVIIVVFLVCIVPSAFSNRPIAMLLFGRGQTLLQFTTSSKYRCLRAVTNMLVIMNSSLNFIIYCLFSHKFVITLKFLMWKALYRVCGERCLGKSRFRRLANTTATVRTPSLSSFNQVLIYPPPSENSRQVNKPSIAQWDSLDKKSCRNSLRSVSTQFGAYASSPMRHGRSKTISSSSSSSSLPSLLTTDPLLGEECLRQCSSTQNTLGIGADE